MKYLPFVFVWLIGTTCAATHQITLPVYGSGPYTWEIISIKITKYSQDHADESSEPRFDCVLRIAGPKLNIEMDIMTSGRELIPILAYFRKGAPEELISLKFRSVHGEKDPECAFNRFSVECAHGMRYTPPSPQRIYEMTAAALSHMHEPDFSAIDKATIGDAFSSVVRHGRADEEWLAWLSGRILKLSDGFTELHRANPDDASRHLRCCAEYMVLVSNRESKTDSSWQMFILIGDNDPIIFIPSKSPVRIAVEK